MNATTFDELQKRDLTFRVEKRQLVDSTTGKTLPLFGTFRADNDFFLGGVVTERYQTIQNEDALDIFPALGEVGLDYRIKRMGAFNGGASVFADVRLPGLDFNVGPRQVGDIVGAGLLAKTAHDGSSKTVTMGYLNRLVCGNGMVLRMKMFVFAIQHTSGAIDKLKKWAGAIHGVVAGIKQFQTTASTLASLPIRQDDIEPIFDDVFRLHSREEWDKSPRIQKRARAILNKFRNQTEYEAQRGTAWALYNAFTNFSDHDLTFRRMAGNPDTPEQTNLRGIMFGAGEALKFTAFNTITARMNEIHKAGLPLMGAKVDD